MHVLACPEVGYQAREMLLRMNAFAGLCLHAACAEFHQCTQFIGI